MSKILYVQTSGVDTPERLYAPFVLSIAAASMNVEASIFFLIKGVTVVKKGEAEKIKIGNMPPVKKFIDQTIAAGVKLFVCEQSTQLFGMARGDFIPEAKISGAATLNDLALEADRVISF
ncbi:MAG: DsrE family protein [bacterium]|nr:DsrE family protein [bacterium]